MISEETQSEPKQSGGAADSLLAIEDLVARARTGEIDEQAALSRIAVLAREATAGDVYQKPWG